MTNLDADNNIFHQLQYGKHLIEKRPLKAGIEWLSKINHPDTDSIILELAKQPNQKRYTRQVIAKALVQIGSPEAIECLIAYYDDIYPTNPMIIRHIHTLDDPRITQQLINRLKIQLQKLPVSLTKLLIEALGKLQAVDAIPLFEQIFTLFPFESKEVFVSKQPLALITLMTLQNMHHPSAKKLVEKWQPIWDAHIAYHLEQDTLFNDQQTRLILSRYLYNNKAIRDYLISKLETESDKNQQKVLMALFLRFVPVADDQDSLLNQLMNMAEATADKKLHAMLITRLSRYPHQRLVPIAFEYINQTDYTEACIRIFVRNKVYSDDVMTLIADIIVEQELQPTILKEYLTYLENHHTLSAEAIAIELINTIDNQKLYRPLYILLAKFANQSDTAFNVLCDIIQNGDYQECVAAINALRHTPERSLSLLLSLVKSKSDYQRTALKTLSHPNFVDAVPHLIQELLTSERYRSRSILTALKGIGTEQAYEAINTWYVTYGHLA